jgi:hypothetical protein
MINTAENVDRFFKEWLVDNKIPSSLHDCFMAELQTKKGHGLTLNSTIAEMKDWLIDNCTTEERARMKMRLMSDRQLLEAVYWELTQK